MSTLKALLSLPNEGFSLFTLWWKVSYLLHELQNSFKLMAKHCYSPIMVNKVDIMHFNDFLDFQSIDGISYNKASLLSSLFGFLGEKITKKT